MLKRVSVDQLRLGMHLHELCGSWMDHPFWRAQFVLRDPLDIRRISECGINEVWIDTGRGLDVEGGRGDAEVRAEVEQELQFVASMPAELEVPSDEQALAQAATLCRKARPQVISMFNEARLGRLTDASSCMPLVDEITNSVLANPSALISVARLKHRDEYTYMHSVAVCALMVGLGRQIGLKGGELRQAGLAGLLHDLGKAVMPTRVLNKPGKLTDAEFTIIKSHPRRGYALLAEGTAGPAVMDVCLHHHEKFDGTGYPDGLGGEQIGPLARMAAVCDVYDAITSDRPYKPGWDPGEAVRKMAQWKGHFDPAMFQAFIRTVGIYPVGSLVRLQSGRLAVVTAQGGTSLLTPKVKVFFSTRSNLRLLPEVLDLGGPWCQDRIVGCEPAEDWKFSDLDLLWGAPPNLTLKR